MALNLVFSLLFTIECIVLTDFCLVLSGQHFKLRYYGLTFCLLFVIVFVSKLLNGLTGLLFVCILPSCALLLYLIWLFAFHDVKSSETVDNGKRMLYGNKRIMVIVPHQDDEINVLGGVFEEYIKYGSEVMLVYAITTGQVGGYRYEEALALCRHIGIPEKNVFFLGYGSMRDKGRHLPIQTKGTERIPAYHEGQEYSRQNMINDLVSMIQEQQPDIIYGSDYDYHIDHHLVTIAIDEALGKVLKSESSYRPTFVKCYAYRTTWEAYPDYYKGVNLGSTRYMSAPVEIYRWDERLRLPISANLLCRSLLRSEIYRQYATFKSQGAAMRAINYKTDKVGWERRSDSILLNAQVNTTSGNGSKLNDFLLYDKEEMASLDEEPLSGAWITDVTDKRQTATFIWAQPKNILYVDIYNNPSKEHRVKRVSLSFNNDNEIITDLDSEFVRTRIFVHQKDIVQLSLKVLEKQGQWAGITEIEAFEDDYQSDFSFVKWTNQNVDFIYDYWIHPSGKEKLKVYSCGKHINVTAWQVESSNPVCKVESEGDSMTVECPKGQHSLLTVKSAHGEYVDTIEISNPSYPYRIMTIIGQEIESIYYDIFIGDQHRKATTLSVLAFLKLKVKNVVPL